MCGLVAAGNQPAHFFSLKMPPAAAGYRVSQNTPIGKKGWNGLHRSNPFCQGEEEEKEVVLCFRVKVPVKQAIQEGGMLLQGGHEVGGLRLRQVAIFDGLVHGALDGVQRDGVQLRT